MNTKIIGGFLAGIIVAGGSVFLLMRDKAAPIALAAVAGAAAPAAVPSTPVEAPKSAFRRAQPEEIQRRSQDAANHAEPVAAQRLPADPKPPAVSPILVPEPRTPTPPQPHIPISTASDSRPAPAQPERVETPKPVELRKAQSLTVTTGTLLPVRLNEQVSSEKNVSGDLVMATLSEPLVVNGFVIAERGARAECRLVKVTRAGKVKGVAHLALELISFHSSDGQKVNVHSATFEKEGEESKKSDAAKIGTGAAIGAIIGAIAGGGKGAAVGAGAGGAAGAGGVLLTRGKPAVLPVETKISFRITEPVTITERLK